MSDKDSLSEPDKQERISESLDLLAGLAPAELAGNRDALFFRAGEASARGEMRGHSRAARWLWPATAAALALTTAALGAALVTRYPEVQVVYVQSPADGRRDEVPSAAQIAPPRQSQYEEAMEFRRGMRTADDPIRRGLPTGDLIPRQDWAALSDAFAQQLRLQQERSRAARDTTLSAAVVSGGGESLGGEAPRERASTYLELRDAMQAM